jgi:hypothetical protein
MAAISSGVVRRAPSRLTTGEDRHDPHGRFPPARNRRFGEPAHTVSAAGLRLTTGEPSLGVALPPGLAAFLDRRQLEPPELSLELRALSLDRVLRELRAELVERERCDGIPKSRVPVVHGGTPVDVDPNVIGGEWARHETEIGVIGNARYSSHDWLAIAAGEVAHCRPM